MFDRTDRKEYKTRTDYKRGCPTLEWTYGDPHRCRCKSRKGERNSARRDTHLVTGPLEARGVTGTCQSCVYSRL
jgi:hypothetical protein